MLSRSMSTHGGETSGDVLDSSDAAASSVRGGTIRVAGYVGELVLSLISAPLVIRHLGLAMFGQYTAAMAIVTLTGGITEFGLRDATIREYSTTSGAARDEFMSSAIGLRLVLSLAGIIAAAAFAGAIGDQPTIVVGVVLAGLGQLFTALQVLYAVPLAAGLRLTLMTLLDFGQQVVNVALLVTLVVAGLGVGAFLDVQVVIPVPELIATAWLVRRLIPLVPRFDAARWRRLLAATVPFAGISVVSIFYLRLSVIFISLDSTKLQTGYFSTSYRVITALIYIPSVLVASAFPVLSRAARDDTSRFTSAVRRMFDIALLGGAVCALGLIVGAPFIVEVLAGGRGHPAVAVLEINALVILSSFLIALGGYALLSIHRARVVLGSIAAGLVVNFALLALLVPAHGAVGAAIAAACGEAVIAIAETVVLVRVSGTRVSLRSAIPLIAAAAAWAVAKLTPLPSLPATVLALVVYGGIVVATGFVSKESIEPLRRSA
jgi:O-antigen/teichoic acid export membrane protein